MLHRAQSVCVWGGGLKAPTSFLWDLESLAESF